MSTMWSLDQGTFITLALPLLESRIKTEVLQMHTTLYTEFPIRLKPTPKVTRLGAGLITNVAIFKCGSYCGDHAHSEGLI